MTCLCCSCARKADGGQGDKRRSSNSEALSQRVAGVSCHWYLTSSHLGLFICSHYYDLLSFCPVVLGNSQDPREKAKNEQRDWLNNMVGEMESQIDSFESEMEGLQVRLSRGFRRSV